MRCVPHRCQHFLLRERDREFAARSGSTTPINNPDSSLAPRSSSIEKGTHVRVCDAQFVRRTFFRRRVVIHALTRRPTQIEPVHALLERVEVLRLHTRDTRGATDRLRRRGGRRSQRRRRRRQELLLPSDRRERGSGREVRVHLRWRSRMEVVLLRHRRRRRGRTRRELTVVAGGERRRSVRCRSRMHRVRA